jgi:hypothetical protein
VSELIDYKTFLERVALRDRRDNEEKSTQALKRIRGWNRSARSLIEHSLETLDCVKEPEALPRNARLRLDAYRKYWLTLLLFYTPFARRKISRECRKRNRELTSDEVMFLILGQGGAKEFHALSQRIKDWEENKSKRDERKKR